MLQLGWEVGSRMLVEGIETEAQYRAMCGLGVELYQGFYLGRPGFLPVRCEL
ncbi:EAL domain protein [compost metagenome]